MSDRTIVEAHRVGKVYWDGDRSLEILKNVSLSVRQGESIAVLGPSGSGKTTLLNVLSGLDRASAGIVRLGGVDLGQLSADQCAELRNRCLGFVFQFYYLLPEFTAYENVLLPTLIAGSRAKAGRAASLLERVGLKDRAGHYPSELSGGEQQRVAIARALVNDPEILFCDEPTGNLDAQTGAMISELLRGFCQTDKKTMLVVTHDRQIAQSATRIWNIVTGNWE